MNQHYGRLQVNRIPHLERTNITEGESMFPYSPSTAHESAVCSSVSPSPFCASSIMRRPPGCTHQKSTFEKKKKRECRDRRDDDS